MSERKDEEREQQQREERGFVVIDRRAEASEDSASEPAESSGGAQPGAPPTAEPDTAEPDPGSAPAPGQIPGVDFSTIIHSFAISALVHLGAAPDPETGQAPEPNIPLARQNIDILELLRSKTQGNLDAEESKLLDGLLYEVRMRFVEATQPER